jgi:hypothetical protein
MAELFSYEKKSRKNRKYTKSQQSLYVNLTIVVYDLKKACVYK